MRQVSSRCFFGKSLWFFILSALMLVAMLAWTGCSSSGPAQPDTDGADRSVLHHRDGHGGGGGGKPGDGGGDPPPDADPAIVYQVDQAQIQVMNADGSNQNAIFNGGGLRYPAWSPDGGNIAFTYPTSSNAIYSVNLDGSGLYEIFGFHSGGFDVVKYPAWSPSTVPGRGERIAFSGTASAGYRDDIYLISPSGDIGTFEALTNTADIYETSPTWSLNATRLAYVKESPDPEASGFFHEIWVHDFTTNEASQVVLGGPFIDTKIVIRGLDWARTQDKIVFSGYTSGHEIWVVDLADPANPVQLTDDPDDVHFLFPSWSPDDSEIVFNKGYTGGKVFGFRGEIWKMNADGSGKTLLADGKGQTSFWSPDWKR